jgi:hypothetical protein
LYTRMFPYTKNMVGKFRSAWGPLTAALRPRLRATSLSQIRDFYTRMFPYTKNMVGKFRSSNNHLLGSL